MPEFSLPRDIVTRAMGRSSFEEQLRDFSETHMKLRLDQELEAIVEQGRRLCRNMTLAELKKYREMVAGFLRMCLSGGLRYREEKFSSRYGKTRVLSIIKVVDEKLVALAQELISRNRDALKILGLIEDIRGLLLDLYT